MSAPRPPFRYLVVDDYGGVTGTNDSNVARQAFFDGSYVVIDCLNAESFEEPGPDTSGDIRFERIPAYHDEPSTPEAPAPYGGTD